MIRYLVLAGFGIAAATGASMLMFDPLLRAALFNPAGYVSEGEFAGVRIGSNREVASGTLSDQGLRRNRIEQGGQCLMRRYHNDTTIDVFVDPGRFIRRGTVCVATVGGAVSEVSWFYGGP